MRFERNRRGDWGESDWNLLFFFGALDFFAVALDLSATKNGNSRWGDSRTAPAMCILKKQ
ncbi:MAG: hypothetical protein C4527_15390 [Candidatus Omnitrophota bacterium]|jgi:hypothetical protein|nr:MAG: hypothetical protein C4527_15390 [Candidatus Omnitrophota bacterium]